MSLVLYVFGVLLVVGVCRCQWSMRSNSNMAKEGQYQDNNFESIRFAKDVDASEAVTQFSLDLAKSVLRETSSSGNAILSPLGVDVLLSVLQQGVASPSSSSRQLQDVLHLDSGSSRRMIPPLLRNVYAKPNSKSTLEMGNRLFANMGFRLKTTFRDSARQYAAEVVPLDFRDSRKAAEAINKWVGQATHGRITNIIGDTDINADTHLVLASAMYFRGVWLHTFDPNRTSPDTFSRDSYNMTVPMMRILGDFRAGDMTPELGAQWLELPFDGQRFSMFLVLPNKKDGVLEVLDHLTPEHLMYMSTARSALHRVSVKLPRFHLETDVSLARVLQQLGMRAIFSRNANLTGIVEGTNPIVVSDVLHKAEMKVDEQGSTASAASAVLVNPLSLVSFVEANKFDFDHPFLAIIFDKVNHVPLFLARISDPSI